MIPQTSSTPPQRRSANFSEELLTCLVTLRRPTGAEDFKTFVRDFLVADRLVQGLEREWGPVDFVSTDFAQTLYRRNGSQASFGRGHLGVYKHGPAEWRIDTNLHCKTVMGKSGTRRRLAKRYAQALYWATAFALPQEPMLYAYEATLAQSKDGGAAVRLVPRIPQGELKSIELEFGLGSHEQAFVYRSTVRLRTGERIETRLNPLKGSVLPHVQGIGVRENSDRSIPTVRCGGSGGQ